MQPTDAQDSGSGDDNDNQQQQQAQVGTGSGEGAASAYARMKSLHEHLARQKPADEGSPGGHHGKKP